MMKKYLLTLLLASSFISVSSHAENFTVTGTISRTLVQPNAFKGCMINLAIDEDIGGNCDGKWVSSNDW